MRGDRDHGRDRAPLVVVLSLCRRLKEMRRVG